MYTEIQCRTKSIEEGKTFFLCNFKTMHFLTSTQELHEFFRRILIGYKPRGRKREREKTERNNMETARKK